MPHSLSAKQLKLVLGKAALWSGLFFVRGDERNAAAAAFVHSIVLLGRPTVHNLSAVRTNVLLGHGRQQYVQTV
jgi:hypothetical protein